MSKLFFLLFLTSVCLSFSKDSKSYLLQTETDLYYPINYGQLDDGKVQIFVGLLDEKLHRISTDRSSNFDFFKEAKPLDYYNYWEQKGEEDYYILLTKVVYVLDKEVDFFNESLLTNLEFLQKKMPDYDLEKISTNKFHIDCGFLSPSFDYDLNFYRPPFTDNRVSRIEEFVKQINPELGSPTLSVLQHNHSFSRVMMHKTSKMSVCVSNYYPYGDEKTIEVNYTLNYIHELPPNFLGGYKLLLKEIKSGIVDLIVNTRAVCATL
ncbi:hypothetical protein [Chondrinema litorale]|uniref:hypothetical protein n=1 Tax=Chondrinema litorale TaxID=2994555 RepID=UPI0025428179|nr:hypothetical protein [Chondrinema litorale]UZR93361.1 hypothetical protein OQ292_16015 [Chondrinema litorale]